MPIARERSRAASSGRRFQSISFPHTLGMPMGWYPVIVMLRAKTSPLFSNHTCGWKELLTMMLFSTVR